MQVQQRQHLGHLRGLACPRRQDRRGKPLPLTRIGVDPFVVDPRRTSAQERKIALTGLSPFWHGTSHRTQGIVVGYGTPPEHEYTTALQHLGQLMRTVANRSTVE